MFDTFKLIKFVALLYIDFYMQKVISWIFDEFCWHFDENIPKALQNFQKPCIFSQIINEEKILEAFLVG